MNVLKTILILVLALILWPTETLIAQNQDTGLTQKQAQVVIDSIGNKLKANYVFPEMAGKMVDKLNNNLKNGLYKKIDNAGEFAAQLTVDLQSISHDKHLKVMFDPKRVAEQKKGVSAVDSIQFLNSEIARMKHNNYGFKEVSILEGNIGYLDLRVFYDTEYAGETAVAAMNFLSNTDAIIFDLRQNRGGSPGMIQLIISYLYGAEPVLLNNFYWRPTDTNTQTWTLPHISGKRNPDTPVYILTSSSTFSAAEEFSYDLKNLKRATLIGETTGGAAHIGGPVIATDRFMVWLPIGKAINPITKTNWEGTGVVPHFEVKAEDALQIAHVKALENLIDENEDSNKTKLYKWTLQGKKAMNNPVELEKNILKTYAGVYGPRVISLEEGKLYYQKNGGAKLKLVAMNNNEFMLVGKSYYRIRFLSKKGKIKALEIYYDYGRISKSERTN